MKEFKDVVLINDISKYSIAQINEIMFRCNECGVLFGECNETNNDIFNVINASHVINTLYIDDNKLIGNISILKTYMGNILNDLSIHYDILQYIEPVMYDDRIKTFDFIIKQSALCQK